MIAPSVHIPEVGLIAHGVDKLKCTTHGWREPCVVQFGLFTSCVTRSKDDLGQSIWGGKIIGSHIKTSRMHMRTRIANVLILV